MELGRVFSCQRTLIKLRSGPLGRHLHFCDSDEVSLPSKKLVGSEFYFDVYICS